MFAPTAVAPRHTATLGNSRTYSVHPSIVRGSFRSRCNTHTGSFISPELGEALKSIKGVVAAFERDIRSDVKWDSALVREYRSIYHT